MIRGRGCHLRQSSGHSCGGMWTCGQWGARGGTTGRWGDVFSIQRGKKCCIELSTGLREISQCPRRPPCYKSIIYEDIFLNGRLNTVSRQKTKNWHCEILRSPIESFSGAAALRHLNTAIQMWHFTAAAAAWRRAAAENTESCFGWSHN